MLYLGLYQINATCVWWVPLKQRLTRDQETALTEWVWNHLLSDFTPAFDEVR